MQGNLPSATTSTDPRLIGDQTIVEQPDLPDLDTLKRRYQVAIETTQTARDEMATDRGYFDGTGAISKEWKDFLTRAGLVITPINIVKDIVSGHLGVILANQTDPQAWARTEASQNASDIATKLLRYASDVSRFDDRKAEVAENMLIEGMGAVLIEADGKKLFMKRIHPREFFYDPRSREYDFSDAKYMGMAKWYEIEDVLDQFPHIGENLSPGDLLASNTNKDAPSFWTDKKHQRILVVEMYWLDRGQWQMTTFCHAGILDHRQSQYQDDDGHTICPIVAMSAFINMDESDSNLTNARYGVVRNQRGPQDKYNALSSAMLKASITRRVQQVDTSLPSPSQEIVRQEAARIDGVLAPGWQMVPGPDFGQFASIVAQARAEIDRTGPTPSVLGRSLSDSQSGRSRMVAQNAGLTELAPVISRVERFEEEVYRRMWWAARQFWTGPMDIRITGEGQAAQFMKVNVPVMGQKPQPVMGPDGQPVAHPLTGQPLARMMPAQVGTNNELARIDVDITITPVKESATLMHEVRDQLVEVMKVIPVGSPQFLMALKSGLFPIADRHEVVERLEAMMAEAQQANQQAEQAQLQQTLEAKQLATAEVQAKMVGQLASAKKHAAEADRTAVEAHTMAVAAGAQDHAAQVYHGLLDAAQRAAPLDPGQAPPVAQPLDGAPITPAV